MITFSTRFRFASIALDVGALSAIILECESRVEALRLFTYLSDYLVSKDVSKFLDLKFEQTGPDVGDFLLRTEYDEQSMRCRIEGIEWQHVLRLTQSMITHAYYLLLVGYSEKTGAFELLKPSLHHMFRSEIAVNDVCVRGRKASAINYDEIVQMLG